MGPPTNQHAPLTRSTRDVEKSNKNLKSKDYRCGSLVFDVNEGVGCGQEDKGCSWLRGWAEYAAVESALPSNGSGFADDSTWRFSPGRNDPGTPGNFDGSEKVWLETTSSSNIAAENRPDTARFWITLMENRYSGSFVNVGVQLDAP